LNFHANAAKQASILQFLGKNILAENLLFFFLVGERKTIRLSQTLQN